jgi:hypothetical protein
MQQIELMKQNNPNRRAVSPFPARFNRREAVRLAIGGAFGLLTATALAEQIESLRKPIADFEGQEIFYRIVNKAKAEHWTQLPIGQLMGKIAMEFKGTPYVGFTLELSRDSESCVVNFKGLDCVTFFEDTLDMARMLKHGKSTPEDLIHEVQFTRYRDGKRTDFASRLHYTTDWFVNNQKKGVIKILTPELPGAQPFTQKVGIMSAHPNHYRQLAAHPELVPEIRQDEDRINALSLMYLPMDKLAGAEHLLQTGDIVGVATTERGIDIAHTGLCIKDDQGIVHFMDASSKRSEMQVTLDRDISKCLNWSHRLTGVMFARPLEVS